MERVERVGAFVGRGTRPGRRRAAAALVPCACAASGRAGVLRFSWSAARADAYGRAAARAGRSFEDEFSTLDANISGTHHVLAALKDLAPQCRFYFAGSSEMMGKARQVPQTEETAFRPRSAYGISKVAGFELTRNYRESYNVFTASGILYNHESPRRGYEFVTRKITSHAARIKLGQVKELRLGNLDALRDWGHAKDYVRAMWLMLQQDRPDDYIVATGRTRSVRDFAQQAFAAAGLDWEKYVVVDAAFFRPTEAEVLVGDASKARRQLGWEPSIPFDQMVRDMVEDDLVRFEGKAPVAPGTGAERPPR